ASLGVAFTATTKIRFTANDANPQGVVEAGVDAVQVQKIFCETGPGTPLCAGDGSSTACPCSNNANTSDGCANSPATGGAHLSPSGTASPDTVVLTVIGERPTALTVFFQGSASVSTVHYGDGLRCVGGTLKRLYSKNASAGQAAAPTGSELSVTAQSAA